MDHHRRWTKSVAMKRCCRCITFVESEVLESPLLGYEALSGFVGVPSLSSRATNRAIRL